jgi:hypothetical protein
MRRKKYLGAGAVVALGALAAVLVLVNTGGGGSATTITPDVGSPGRTVPSDFIGFSAETANTCALVALSRSPEFAQLFRNLGPGVLRVGGDTVEDATWDPSGASTTGCVWNHTVITPALVDGAFAFASSVGWKVMWSVALKTPNPSEAAAEANYVAAKAGSTLFSLEFGNEPNLYRHTSDARTIANWNSEVQAFRAVNTTAPISGPAAAGAPTNYAPAFLASAATPLAALTEHEYFGPASSTNPKTIGDLLSPAMIATAQGVFAADVALGEKYKVPVILNETGSYVHYGQAGVSNAFASALWGADYLFTGLDAGLDGMYFHGVPNNAVGNSAGMPEVYSPLEANGTPAPLYYGMLLFHYATQGGGTVVPVTVKSSLDLTAHAILGPGKSLRVVLINKSAEQVTTTVAAPGYSSGRLISLTAPSPTSTGGVTFGGSAVNPTTGAWTPNPADEQAVSVSAGRSKVVVPASSAVVITYG